MSTRRGFMARAATAGAVLQSGWWPFGDDDSDGGDGGFLSPDASAADVEALRERVTALEDTVDGNLEHGEHVDTPAGVHHTRPAVGSFLVENAGAFDVDLTIEEGYSTTMPAADSGTWSISLSGAYDYALPVIRLPIAGSVLSDVRAVPRSPVTTQENPVKGWDVAWTNGDTSEQTAEADIIGFGGS